MFNFGMNLFLFYKWHKAIDRGDSIYQTMINSTDAENMEQMEEYGIPTPTYEDEELESTPAYDLGKK